MTMNKLRIADKPIDPDSALITRMGQEDAGALSELMDRHMRKIHAAAFRMLGDAARAEDVTQIVFLSLWQTAPQWEFGRATALTYLYRMTTHRCLDILRKSKEALPGILPDITDAAPNAFDKLADVEQHGQIDAALNQLPERQKVALVLFYYEQQSLKDAALIMDIKPAAFESLLRRARQALKPLLIKQNVKTSL